MTISMSETKEQQNGGNLHYWSQNPHVQVLSSASSFGQSMHLLWKNNFETICSSLPSIASRESIFCSAE